MVRFVRLVLLLVLPVLAFFAAPGGAEELPALGYRTSSEVSARLRRLVARYEVAGIPARIQPYGESAGGRPLEAIRIGEARPVVFVHGGLGTRDAAGVVAALQLAETLGDEAHAALREVTWLIAPAPNPDALDRFLEGAWPHGGGWLDRDKDGRRAEDGPEDVDADGHILRMRRRSPRGTWKAREKAPGWEGASRGMDEAGEDLRRGASYELFDEGLDRDGDGRVNEDPPGIRLDRDFAGWWDDKAPWRGDGLFPGSAPETRAMMELTFAETGLVAWLGFTSAGPTVLRANEQGKTWELDRGLYDKIAARIEKASAHRVRSAHDALGKEQNPGSDLDWAAVHLGVPAFRAPLWWVPKQDGYDQKREHADETDWLLWNDRELEGAGFVPWRAFEHPALGRVEIGGWTRFTRYEPPPDRLASLTDEALKVAFELAGVRPVLGAEVEILARGEGLYEISLRAQNSGGGPTNTVAAERQRRAVGVRARFEASSVAEVLAGPRVADLGRVEGGKTSRAARWLVRREGAGRLGTLRVTHPKADDHVEEVTTP